MKYYHTTRDGTKIPLSEMETNHLINMINFIKKKAKSGVRIIEGSKGYSTDEMWYDETVLYGKKVKQYFCYKQYKKELKKRLKNNE